LQQVLFGGGSSGYAIDMDEQQGNGSQQEGRTGRTGTDLALGMPLGIVIGILLFDNIAIAIAVGIALGIAIGLGFDAARSRRDN
jgi:hypothetical protein